MNRLVVLGQGFVGLPMALHPAEMGLSEMGLSVVGLDTDIALVRALNAGVSHVDGGRGVWAVRWLHGLVRGHRLPPCR